MYNHTTFRELISDVICSNIIAQTCHIDTLLIFSVATVVALRKRFVVVSNVLVYVCVGKNYLIKCSDGCVYCTIQSFFLLQQFNQVGFVFLLFFSMYSLTHFNLISIFIYLNLVDM